MPRFSNAKEKFDYMTKTPVQTLVLKLADPTILSMLISSLYNMADTFFVGQIGTSATAAVGIVFSLMAIIQAIGFFFGHGSGNFISMAMGSQDSQSAEKMAAVGFFSCFAFSAILGALGLLFIDPLVWFLGATETIFPHAKSYATFILIGMPFMSSALTLNNQLRFEGSAFFAMVGIVTGAVLNIALDPLLIFTFGMGVGGAGLATIISQFVSFCLLFIGLRKNANIPIRLRNFKPSGFLYRKIVSGGLPSMARQGLASVAQIILNTIAGGWGDAAIAGLSVVNRIAMFASSAMIGFGQGFQPVCGVSYGARMHGRIKEAFSFCVRFSFLVLLAMSVAGFIFAGELVGFFRNDPDVISIGRETLRFQCIAFPFTGFTMMVNMMLQTVNKTRRATILAMCRQGVVFIPVLLAMKTMLGLRGVEMTQMITDFIGLLIAYPFCRSFFNEIGVGQKNGSPRISAKGTREKPRKNTVSRN